MNAPEAYVICTAIVCTTILIIWLVTRYGPQ